MNFNEKFAMLKNIVTYDRVLKGNYKSKLEMPEFSQEEKEKAIKLCDDSIANVSQLTLGDTSIYQVLIEDYTAMKSKLQA